MNEKLYMVGKIVNTHGVRGEVKILPQTDFPEIRFAVGSVLQVLHPQHKERLSFEIETSRVHKQMYIVKFKGINNINEIEKYKGADLKVTEDELLELPEDEYYFHEIIGCEVFTDEGEQLGTVTEVLTPGANDVWVVSRPGGKPVLIPVIDDVLLGVDVPNKTIRIHLMEGLI